MIHININKFNYQIIEENTVFFNNTKIGINKMENDLNNEYQLIKEVITEIINEFDGNINYCKYEVNNGKDELKKSIEDK